MKCNLEFQIPGGVRYELRTHAESKMTKTDQMLFERFIPSLFYRFHDCDQTQKRAPASYQSITEMQHPKATLWSISRSQSHLKLNERSKKSS